jgi:hypothetical protein
LDLRHGLSQTITNNKKFLRRHHPGVTQLQSTAPCEKPPNGVSRELYDMSTFELQFLKTVCNSRGHDHTICQRAIDVEAPSAEVAFAKALAEFCRLEHVPHWTLHADMVELRPQGALRHAMLHS